MRKFIFYLTESCFFFCPAIIFSFIFLNLAKTAFSGALDTTMVLDQVRVIGLILCTVVPMSLGVGWLFLRIWVVVARSGMTEKEVRKIIELGLGIKGRM